MDRPKVLIIGNSDGDINEIEAILNGGNLELVHAHSGKEGVKLVNQSEFALVIIEVNPDVTEGSEIAEAIRIEKKNEHLNILYITNNCCETYNVKDLLFIGAVDFIARPFIAGILKGKVESVIDQYLQRKQLEDELEQRKIIEKELSESKEQEEEAVVAKTQFLSTMSHEIRTPLNAIINTINLLISEKPRGDQLEDIDVLKFSAENLLQLINEILDFSKIDNGKIEFEEIDFNIRKLISGIKQSLQYGMVKNGNSLDFYIEEKVPDFLVGDSVRLAQIFFNLIGNALKFTEQGKVSLTVEVAQDLDDHLELKFRISDTGIGIPEE